MPEFKTEPYITDSHHHLSHQDFSSDIEEVIGRAREAGVEILIEGGGEVALPYYLKNCLSDPYLRNMYFCAGLHPHDAMNFSDSILDKLRSLATHKRFAGVGECGLDYHYDNSPRDVQKRVFRKHIELASELKKPLVIHARKSYRDVFEILEDEGVPEAGVLFHCFSGGDEDLARILEMDGYISIGGVLTFPNAVRTREVISSVPRERLLIETDAPYLAPQNVRGKRNEPSYIRYVADELANLWGLPVEDVYFITTYNARVFFNIDIDHGGDIVYKLGDRLYLNVTNRCTNRCSFCIRNFRDGLGGYYLKLRVEPTPDEVIKAIGIPGEYEEIVFCGYGEPLIRYDLVREVARYIKERGGRVRVNTNGIARLYHGVDAIEYVSNYVDVFSISLNATNGEEYNRICRPLYKGAYKEVLKSIERAKSLNKEVRVSFVESSGADLTGAEDMAEALGVSVRFR